MQYIYIYIILMYIKDFHIVVRKININKMYAYIIYIELSDIN